MRKAQTWPPNNCIDLFSQECCIENNNFPAYLPTGSIRIFYNYYQYNKCKVLSHSHIDSKASAAGVGHFGGQSLGGAEGFYSIDLHIHLCFTTVTLIYYMCTSSTHILHTYISSNTNIIWFYLTWFSIAISIF